MDPNGIWAHLPSKFSRHNKTFAIIAFSDIEPKSCTIASYSRSITFPLTENWLLNLQEFYIKPLDITHLFVYGKNGQMEKLLSKTLFNVVVQVFYPPKNCKIKCSYCLNFLCTILKAEIWLEKFYRLKVKLPHWI